MRLADFILANLEPILQAWEDFASTLQPASGSMDSAQLRDHAQQMLEAIAKDLATPQSPAEQAAKSRGAAIRHIHDTAAETHAVTRLASGFTVEQLVAEYRALRASVLLLWSQRIKDGIEFELEDMMRFNEAIDQATAESVVRYSASVAESQHLFLGILGHDLRTPLGAISLGAELLLRSEDLDSRHTKVASRIFSSVGRAKSIVDSLLDFTRSHFGGGIPIQRRESDLTAICKAMVEEVRAYHPDRTIVFDADGPLVGSFDAERMEQVVCNILENAVQHGIESAPVSLGLQSDGIEAALSVTNQGTPIAQEDIPNIFNPMSNLPLRMRDGVRASSGVGLGLYIAREIVIAHGGNIEVSSAPEGTSFTVRIPLGKAQELTAN